MSTLVVEPQTLRALKVALTSTSANAEEAHRVTVLAAEAVVAEIRAAVAARESTVRSCEAAFDACLRSDRDDCSAQAAALDRARARLDAARRAFALATQSLADYRSRAGALRHRAEQTHARGQAFLDKKLDRVTAVTAGAGTSGGVVGGVIGGGSGGGAAAAGPSAGAGVHRVPGLPPGCVMVPIDMIDQTEMPIQGPQDFGKGYSIEDLDYAFDLLESRILPALASGAHPDTFSAQDQAHGIYGVRSLADTYGGFLNPHSPNRIRVELGPNGLYRIINGRHRIYVADHGGRTHVPAFVMGGRP